MAVTITAAQSFDIFVLILPNADWDQGDGNPLPVNKNISYHLDDFTDLRTLSTNVDADGGGVQGLLYVPELQTSDPCFNVVKAHVPHNATGRANLPEGDLSLVALAPWLSVNCTQSYLAAARLDPVKAFYFYQPDNGTAQPPPVSDPEWTLQDGGQWKSINKFPAYAIPGSLGADLMGVLSQYSGNMTNVPNGPQLTEIYDSRDFVRLYTRVAIGDNGSGLPSLWVFLLIVLGILVSVIGLTSLVMHWFQRKHRQSLQRRVANGEVDLESLGIKRLNVPPALIDKMPVYLYAVDKTSRSPARPEQAVLSSSSYGPSDPVEECSATETVASGPVRSLPDPSHMSTAQSVEQSAPESVDQESSGSNNVAVKQVPFTQPTCPICLDDFIVGTSLVRELPCTHIFHPDCVDGFLANHSSLCPMCKKSTLPAGYFPDHVTNAMVRRERLVRRMRQRVTVEVVEPQTRFLIVQDRVPRFHRHQSGNPGRRYSSAPASQATEMRNVATANVIPPEIRRADTSRRREWGRERAAAMVGTTRTVEDEEREQSQAMPRWRKAASRMFPGFR